MFKIKEKIIHLLGGYSKYDLEKYIKEDRKSRDIVRTVQFQITKYGNPEGLEDEASRDQLYKVAFRNLVDNALIHKAYNPRGHFTNYFLIYDIPFNILQERCDYYEERE